MESEEERGQLNIYSLSGYNEAGILEEVFLTHSDRYHANEFQSMVIFAVGKLRKKDNYDEMAIHDVSRLLEEKFDFRRANFLNCYVWDKERNVICDATVKV